MHPALWIKESKGGSLSGKRIILGICGSIAAVKCVELARELIRHGADVKAVMSKEAQRILHPNALHYATGNLPVLELDGTVQHVEEFGEKGQADLLLIAPCTANTIGKIACGIDDTPVTTFATTALGSKKPVILVPAMHESMYENRIVAENIKRLKEAGVAFVEPMHSECAAKFPNIWEIVLECERALGSRPLEGKQALIASGAVQEDIDPIRVLTTRASGKTGLELAKEAYRLGAKVKIIHSNFAGFSGIEEIAVRTGKEMHDTVLKELEKEKPDFFLIPAALSDFTVKKSENKITSEKPVSLELLPAKKLVEEARKRSPGLFIVGFKAETNVSGTELVERATKKMVKAKMQLIVANDVGKKGIGEDSNTVTIISKQGQKTVSGKKEIIAKEIWKEALKEAGLTAKTGKGLEQ